MCKYVKNSHSCQHKSYRLTDTCQYALSSSPGSCGRIDTCEDCTRKRAQLDYGYINTKIDGWMRGLEKEEFVERVGLAA
ncbi:hypothetical protein TWF103_006821 [Orbilia oligospora]|nr:hypothetical protein TWF103_006821 [Orbilia oligospora]KAF3175531.1 hypothetical protein TWF751_003936 [Orbilia oligospora]KAF3253742.1 hypothetical protein TWF128_006365 [Orbilia oligospora]KAF3297875.1 hypothetical protein TWF132_004024 [Orbilia oligospora]